jgi:cell division protein FtsI/penicillin-binding protein 2
MNSAQNSRFLTIGVAFSVIGVLIFGQMVNIQNRPDIKDLQARIEANNNSITLKVVPERGAIFDRNGKLLAGSKEVYEIGIDLKIINEKTAEKETEAIARAVATVIGADYNRMLELTRADRNTFLYMRLADGVEPAKVDQLRQIKQAMIAEGQNLMRAIVLVPHLQRSYPEKSTAANVLGYVKSLDPKSPIGVNGVEGHYNAYLAGITTTVSIPRSPYDITSIPNMPSGASLILTIDREIQSVTEQILDKAVKNTGSTSGTAIIMDPRTGEILAMVSTPRIDANEYWRVNEELLLKKIPWNRAISQIYEPGSIFKPITMALAIDSGAVKRDTHYNDVGFFDAPGKRITNWDYRAYGDQTMTGCLEFSLNTCLSWVVNQLGEQKFYEGIKAFGIGQPSNVDMDGEDYYPVRLPGDENWTKLSLANNAFGQGVAVAPIQLITALAAIANDGKMMAPHVLKAVVDNGRQMNILPQVISQPVSKETANSVSDMLAEAIKGEARILKIDGYRIAGKTGTAEIPIPEGGGYFSNKTNASFVGWGPVDDPRFIIYVWLEEPGGPMPYGSVLAAPIFKDLFMASVQLTNLPPDAIRQQLVGTSKK